MMLTTRSSVLSSCRHLLPLGAGLLLVGGCSAPGRFVVKVEQHEIQQRVDKTFPKSLKRLLFEVRLERPGVALNAKTDRVEVTMRISAVIAGAQVGHARARVTGGIRYETGRSEFLLTDPRIVAFEASHLPTTYAGVARSAVDRFVNRALPAIPIYRLGRSQRLARSVLKRVWVCDGRLCLEMGL